MTNLIYAEIRLQELNAPLYHDKLNENQILESIIPYLI